MTIIIFIQDKSWLSAVAQSERRSCSVASIYEPWKKDTREAQVEAQDRISEQSSGIWRWNLSWKLKREKNYKILQRIHCLALPLVVCFWFCNYFQKATKAHCNVLNLHFTWIFMKAFPLSTHNLALPTCHTIKLRVGCESREWCSGDSQHATEWRYGMRRGSSNAHTVVKLWNIHHAKIINIVNCKAGERERWKYGNCIFKWKKINLILMKCIWDEREWIIFQLFFSPPSIFLSILSLASLQFQIHCEKLWRVETHDDDDGRENCTRKLQNHVSWKHCIAQFIIKLMDEFTCWKEATDQRKSEIKSIKSSEYR